MSTVINPNSEGQILFHDISIGYGVKFEREIKEAFTKMSIFGNRIHIYSPGIVKTARIGGDVPLLISVNTTIKSKAKLGLQGDKSNEDE